VRIKEHHLHRGCWFNAVEMSRKGGGCSGSCDINQSCSDSVLIGESDSVRTATALVMTDDPIGFSAVASTSAKCTQPVMDTRIGADN